MTVAPAMDSWSEHAFATLRDAGYRGGGARRNVVELLGRQHCCLSAQEIFDVLRSEERPVGIASVYRVLDLLTEQGLLQRIVVGGDVARYEPALPSGEHHHHLVCDDCGKVEAFTDERLESAIEQVGSRVGYEVGAHDVLLRGSCSTCAPARRA